MDNDEVEDIPPLSSGGEDEFEEDGHRAMEIDEDTDGDEDWSDRVSEDSGYDSTCEDEEDFEDDDVSETFESGRAGEAPGDLPTRLAGMASRTRVFFIYLPSLYF